MNKFYQSRVAHWMMNCFGGTITRDRTERNFRFLEEALELVQSCDMTKEQCIALVDYTFARPLGEKRQEVGGVAVTLAALCNAQLICIEDEAERELFRINQPEVMEKIRIKQASKPNDIANSPLP